MMLPEIFTKLKLRPGMVVSAIDYDAAAGFVEGYNAAVDGELLHGLREWLVMKVGHGKCMTWTSLIILLFKEGKITHIKLIDPGEDHHALIEFLVRTLESFQSERDSEGGASLIFKRYEEWSKYHDE